MTTSSLVQFLSHLQSLDLSLSVDGDRLVCQAPKNVITPEIRQELAARKAEILTFLRGTQQSSTTTAAVAAVPGPLSRTQQRLWFLQQLDPGNPVYHVAVALSLEGALDIGALERSLQAIVARHDILRTAFPSRDGVPYARLTASDWRLQRGTTDAVAFARAPFDLAHGPLFRAALLPASKPEQHTLVLVLHHIISDGWSLGLLAQELMTLYAAFAQGQPSPLPPLSHQYADYVRWEQQHAAAAEQREIAYWREQLGNNPNELPIVELPTDRPRPATPTFRGNRLALFLGRDLSTRLQAFSRTRGVTPFMLLLAAFQTLVHRYTGLTDLPIGTPTAGRTRSEFSHLIGLFVNNLVLRTDLSGDPTFVELLARVKRVALEAYDHQHLAFDQLVTLLQPRRDLAYSPLFQVGFALQNVPLPELQLHGLTVRSTPLDPGISRYDFSIEVWDRPDGYQCDFEYATDLYDEPTILRLQQHYRTLLESILDQPTQRLSELPLLTAEERRQLITEWNDTAVALPAYASVVEWIDAQAARTPAAESVRGSESASLTYAELAAQSTQLAHVLREQHGVTNGAVVAVSMERRPHTVVALLAIMKAGGAYLPLDPSLPAERRQFILDDAQAVLTLTDDALAGHQAASVDQPLPLPAPEDPAYLMYTSGSTGQPKGVIVPHRALTNLLASMQRVPGCSAADTLVAVTTFSFDIATLELFLPLVSGGRVVLATREDVLNPRALATLLQDTNATIMQATPSIWRLLVDSGWIGQPGLTMLCGGEALTPELARDLQSRGAALWNVYGPTETTIWSTIHRVAPGEDPIRIGRPIDNTRLYILDAQQRQPVPIGVTGELYIAGAGVATGYHRRPELTAERFVPAYDGNGLMYRTGDLARYLPNGDVQLLGRQDHQVKLRGRRVELGEIESILDQHPDIRQAAVLLREGETLTAYVAPASNRLNTADLRAWLLEKLPDYLIPSSFVFLDAMPLSPSGKVNRQALPAPPKAQTTAGTSSPRTPTERTIAGIWRDVLGLGTTLPGPRDNFFDLGGHSLLMVKVHERLTRELPGAPTLAVLDLFRYPTIETLAGYLDSNSSRGATGA